MKTILTLISVIYSQPWPVVITVMVISLVMFILNVAFLPVYRQLINNAVPIESAIQSHDLDIWRVSSHVLDLFGRSHLLGCW
jgi:hypothetical protein